MSWRTRDTGASARVPVEAARMCRNIRTLYNFVPAATEADVRAAALQFVRKLSGFTRPSATNAEAFDRAVDEISRSASTLLASLVTSAPPHERDAWIAKAKARAAERYGRGRDR